MGGYENHQMNPVSPSEWGIDYKSFLAWYLVNWRLIASAPVMWQTHNFSVNFKISSIDFIRHYTKQTYPYGYKNLKRIDLWMMALTHISTVISQIIRSIRGQKKCATLQPCSHLCLFRSSLKLSNHSPPREDTSQFC